ncbi:MAG: type IV toxin-antitoxin system AbiEi family antitoxin domain-containing protein [Rhodococcus sp. (in: high G+C Gram-positive bacteria)]|uniref:type IV toxin-antitoxin system AbiEi family antitoxin domain-containing protein n=1 Tax=Rhodococcus sp. TaxID=1831 RepID=UPI003BB49EE1
MGELENIIRRSDAHARGVTDTEIRRLCRTGTWTRLTRVVYVPTRLYAETDQRGRHLYRALAAAHVARPGTVLGHVSAAIVHGLDLWRTSLDDVHLTCGPSGGNGRGRGRVLHAEHFEADEVVHVGRVAVMSAARTVADLARTLPFEQAVVTGDHAMRAAGVSGADVSAILSRNPSHPGNAKATRALRFMSGHSESVGESRSRVLFVRSGLPIPQSQAAIYSSAGQWLARVDFLLPEHGVIGEFDGRIKYRRDGVANVAAEEVVFREKQREDRLRDAGWVVVRWVWADLENPDVVVARVREAIARAARGPRPSGHFVMPPGIHEM